MILLRLGVMAFGVSEIVSLSSATEGLLLDLLLIYMSSPKSGSISSSSSSIDLPLIKDMSITVSSSTIGDSSSSDEKVGSYTL